MSGAVSMDSLVKSLTQHVGTVLVDNSSYSQLLF